jgi:Transmembrane secretion effector
VIAGTVGTVQAACMIVLKLPGGAYADRWDRRKTAVICDVARGVVLAVLGLLVITGGVWWPIVGTVAVIDAAGNAIFSPAAMAALPVIVEDEQLRQAWAVTEARTYAAGWPAPRSEAACSCSVAQCRSWPTRPPTSSLRSPSDGCAAIFNPRDLRRADDCSATCATGSATAGTTGWSEQSC